MSRKMYWAFGALAIVIVDFVALQIYLHYDFESFKQEIDSDSKKVVEGVSPTQPGVKRPPPGETVDTGYWAGDTWHQSTPEAVDSNSSLWDKVWLPKRFGAEKYVDILRSGGSFPKEFRRADGTKDYHAFYRQVIAEYPDSLAAFIARKRMVGYGSLTARADDLKALLKYYPDAPGINAEIAFLSAVLSPEESIAFAKKALRLPAHRFEGPFSSVIDTPEFDAHTALGRAYQRLGDYKTALVHLKKVQSLLLPEVGNYFRAENAYETIGKDIAAIKAGKPLFGPDPVEVPAADVPQAPTDFEGLLPSADSDLLVSPAFVDEDLDFFEFLADADDDAFLPERSMSSVSTDDRRVRMRAAAEQAREAFVLEQERKQREFASFLSWMEQIERVRSPAELDDFLMREMAKTLQGEGSTYEADSLIRAYETLSRYGETEGMAKLRVSDAEIAKAMFEARPPERVPPRPREHSQ